MAPGPGGEAGPDAGAASPPPPTKHLDWDRALANHQSEERLRAFLAEYPADLRRIVQDMRQAQDNNDMEKLREAGQQAMGSSSHIAAASLHKCATELVDAIDLEEDGIAGLAANTAQEAEALEKEIRDLNLAAEAAAGAGPENDATLLPPPVNNTPKKACCSIL